MRAGSGKRSWIAAIGVALAMIGLALAQDQPAAKKDQPAAKKSGKSTRKKGGLFAGGAVPPKNAEAGKGADPLARRKAEIPRWPYHYRFRLSSADGATLNVTFYPLREKDDNGPVMLLVHPSGTGHSSRDFEEPIEGLKGQSLAEHLQELGYAVVIPDLRLPLAPAAGAGQREVTPRERQALAADLRAVYLFLIDRHNRRELNLNKLGILGVGDGATLAAAWAAEPLPNGPISSPGRLSDVGAVVLVSPEPEGLGLRLGPTLSNLAPRVPILLIAGEKDAETAKAAQPILERPRLASKVAVFETRLQADRLLRFEPKVIDTIVKFLEDPVKFRTNSEWEPRYLLTPVAATGIETISSKAEDEAKKAEAKKDEAKKDNR
jgi:pimeloyl-ACP methyl ester carboxylesterase